MIRTYGVTFALALLSAAGPAFAQEDRVAELEKQLRATQQLFASEIAALQKPKDDKKDGAVPYLPNSEKAKLYGFAMVRYDYTQGDGDFKGRKVAPSSAFAIDRVRLKLEGDLDALTDYRFQLEITQRNQFQLLDMYVGYKLYGDLLRVQAGQAQPKGYSDGAVEHRQFLDASNSSDTLKAEGTRDRGLILSGSFYKKRLCWETYLVDGNGVSASTHDDTDFRYRFFLKYEPYGPIDPYQNDIGRGPFLLGLASAWARGREVDAKVGHQYKEWFSYSAYGKWRGLYWKAIQAYQRTNRSGGAAWDQDYRSFQAGYSVPVAGGRSLEPVFRYERLDRDLSLTDSVETWATAGLTYYLKGNVSRLYLNLVGRKEQGVSRISNNAIQAGTAIMF